LNYRESRAVETRYKGNKIGAFEYMLLEWMLKHQLGWNRGINLSSL